MGREKMRGQIIVAATTFVRRGGISGFARINTPLDGRFLANQRGIVTSTARLGDDKADTTNLAQKVDPKDAAAKKAAEEATKRALEKKKLEDAKAAKKSEEAAAKKKAEKAAAEKAAEEIAIANMKDPIQDLFLTSIRAYSTSGGLVNADEATKAEVTSELNRVAKQFGGAEGEDMAQFPEFNFADTEVDSINVSSN